MVTPLNEPDTLRLAIDARLAERDRAGAVSAALEAVRDGRVSIPCLYADVLTPLLVGLGAGWQAGQVTVWEEHFASAMVRTIVEALYPEVVRLAAEAEKNGRVAVLACPPQEQHDLGLRMLADRMALAGWTVQYLGADTPASDLVAAAKAFGADTVVLSAATHWHRTMLRSFVDDVEAGLPGVRVLVGGPAFEREGSTWSAEEIADEKTLLGKSGC